MPSDSTEPLATLRRRVRALMPRAHVPFSGAPAAAIVLLDDGHWVPGVRIESAAFSLSLSALANAVTTAVALGRAHAMMAFVLSRPASSADVQYAGALPAGPFARLHDDVFVRGPAPEATPPLPDPRGALSPCVSPEGTEPVDRIAQARDIARRAYIPVSNFPVGALLETADGCLIPGVNVEHEDWGRILCAERNALGAALSYGRTGFEALYLTCPLDPQATPCGACRQWLAELAPAVTLWMDRDGQPPASSSPHVLLPGSFSGQALLRRTR